jgi:transposase-like protein
MLELIKDKKADLDSLAFQLNVKRDTVKKKLYIAIGIRENLTIDVLGAWTNPTENTNWDGLETLEGVAILLAVDQN